jgi:hypothetical protein
LQGEVGKVEDKLRVEIETRNDADARLADQKRGLETDLRDLEKASTEIDANALPVVVIGIVLTSIGDWIACNAWVAVGSIVLGGVSSVYALVLLKRATPAQPARELARGPIINFQPSSLRRDCASWSWRCMWVFLGSASCDPLPRLDAGRWSQPTLPLDRCQPYSSDSEGACCHPTAERGVLGVCSPDSDSVAARVALPHVIGHMF